MVINNIITVLTEFLKEFVPAQKIEILIFGVSLIIMSLCLWEQAVTSGLTGPLTYATLHPGVTFAGLGAGLGCIALTFVFPAQQK